MGFFGGHGDRQLSNQKKVYFSKLLTATSISHRQPPPASNKTKINWKKGTGSLILQHFNLIQKRVSFTQLSKSYQRQWELKLSLYFKALSQSVAFTRIAVAIKLMSNLMEERSKTNLIRSLQQLTNHLFSSNTVTFSSLWIWMPFDLTTIII